MLMARHPALPQQGQPWGRSKHAQCLKMRLLGVRGCHTGGPCTLLGAQWPSGAGEETDAGMAPTTEEAGRPGAPW